MEKVLQQQVGWERLGPGLTVLVSQLRLGAKRYQDLLSERAVQFRAIQRRLLTRFKDKTPAPLQNLDTLLDATYNQVRQAPL